MKKKTVTVLALAHSKRVCDAQPELIDRMEVRRLIENGYRNGYNKAHSEHVKCMSSIIELKVSDIDAPIFTHSNEFKTHFDYIMSKINELLYQY